jgi:osmoprotectant transport system permease protein
MSHLAIHAPRLRLGGDVEFFGRPEWERVRAAYRLDFNSTVGMDASLMYEVARAGELDLIAAFSSDAQITAFDLQGLNDDPSMFPPNDAIVLVSQQAAGKPNIFRALQPLIQSLDDDAMRMTNKLVDVEGVSPQDAASALIRQLEENVSGDPLPGTMMTSD